MAKKNKVTSTEENKQTEIQSSAWLSMKTGLILMGILSIGLVIWVTVQADPVIPMGERILWGLGFAVSLWVIFIVIFVINRYVLKR